MVILEGGFKKCSKCGEVRQISEFCKHKRKKDGLDIWCRDCKKQYHFKNLERDLERRRKYYEEHKEERAEYRRKYCEEHKEERAEYRRKYCEEYKDKISGQRRQYNKDHKDEIKQYHKDHYLNNRDEILKKNRRWVLENKEKDLKRQSDWRKTPKGKVCCARKYHNRRLRKKTSECTLTLDQWQKILKNQNNKCDDCGIRFTSKNPPTMDHIIPLSSAHPEAGLTMENIRAVCGSCNSKKLAKIDKELIRVWLVGLAEV